MIQEFENQITFLVSVSQMHLGFTHKDDHMNFSMLDLLVVSQVVAPGKGEPSRLHTFATTRHPRTSLARGGCSESMFKEELFYFTETHYTLEKTERRQRV